MTVLSRQYRTDGTSRATDATSPSNSSQAPQAQAPADTSQATTYAATRKAVMGIYGHDTEANTALFAWLRTIRPQPPEWSQLRRAGGNASPYIAQVLDPA